MIHLTEGNTSQTIVVTLHEKSSSTSTHYLFVFTHSVTKQVVNVIYAKASDASSYPTRYNQFAINTATVFASKPSGEWLYDVYEQTSNSNTNITGLTKVENGKMFLQDSTTFSYKQYAETTTYKQYAG